jgi:hypothetical protein
LNLLVNPVVQILAELVWVEFVFATQSALRIACSIDLASFASHSISAPPLIATLSPVFRSSATNPRSHSRGSPRATKHNPCPCSFPQA